VLIVADRDFGELIFHQELPMPESFSFDFQERPCKPNEHLNTVLEEHTDELERGEFLVVAPAGFALQVVSFLKAFPVVNQKNNDLPPPTCR